MSVTSLTFMLVHTPRKQPAVRQHHTAPLSFAPPKPQQFEELRRKHGIAVLASLALFNPDQHAFGVDVIDLGMGDLGDAQARTIGNTEGGLVFDARCRLQ